MHFSGSTRSVNYFRYYLEKLEMRHYRAIDRENERYYLIPRKTERMMAKTRSPQYPAIGLKEAIEKVSAVYKKDYQGPTQRDVIASHMGYNSLNGKSLGVLSAVGKYGLLEGRGSDYRVADLAVRILAHQPGDPERAAAIQEAASLPDLFQELDKRFANGKASDQAIRSYLMMQKFIPAAADAAIRSYRETKQLVEEEGGGYHATDEDHPKREPPRMPPKPPDPPALKADQLPSPPPGLTEGTLPFNVAITAGGVEVGARLMTEADVDKLVQTLETMKPLLAVIYGQSRASIVEPITAGRAQQVFEASTEGRNSGGVSFFVTQAQKDQLRERGYTDEQIREMKPEDAHRALGIVN